MIIRMLPAAPANKPLNAIKRPIVFWGDPECTIHSIMDLI